jgi:hypothetical protein
MVQRAKDPSQGNPDSRKSHRNLSKNSAGASSGHLDDATHAGHQPLAGNNFGI